MYLQTKNFSCGRNWNCHVSNQVYQITHCSDRHPQAKVDASVDVLLYLRVRVMGMSCIEKHWFKVTVWYVSILTCRIIIKYVQSWKLKTSQRQMLWTNYWNGGKTGEDSIHRIDRVRNEVSNVWIVPRLARMDNHQCHRRWWTGRLMFPQELMKVRIEKNRGVSRTGRVWIGDDRSCHSIYPGYSWTLSASFRWVYYLEICLPTKI